MIESFFLHQEQGFQRHPLFFLGFAWRAASSDLLVAADAAPAETDVEPGTAEEDDVAVRVASLRKVYSTQHGTVVAVRGLSLELRYGEINCLLGHNGAGKSTTLGMLTGLVVPTAGDCFVCGQSMARNRTVARRCIGMCPQRDVIFDLLVSPF